MSLHDQQLHLIFCILLFFGSTQKAFSIPACFVHNLICTTKQFYIGPPLSSIHFFFNTNYVQFLDTMHTFKLSTLFLLLAFPCLKVVAQTAPYPAFTNTNEPPSDDEEDDNGDRDYTVFATTTSKPTGTFSVADFEDEDAWLTSAASEFMAEATYLDESANNTESTSTAAEPAIPTQAGVCCLLSSYTKRVTKTNTHIQIFVCNEKNWGGDCLYRVEQLGLCVRLDQPW